jgi:hypothetical protein
MVMSAMWCAQIRAYFHNMLALPDWNSAARHLFVSISCCPLEAPRRCTSVPTACVSSGSGKIQRQKVLP